MFGILKILIGGAKVITKLMFVMGLGTLILIKPPFINTDNHFEVIRSKSHVYQVNYEKNKINSVEIFDREGNFIGEFEYEYLKGNHKKVIDSIK